MRLLLALPFFVFAGCPGAPPATCEAGTWGASCAPCACESGVCDDGIDGTGACACAEGWAGEACDVCAEGAFGPDCAPCACVNGLCDDGLDGTGACACDSRWEGAACDTCAAGFTGGDCAACEEGRFGADCEACACDHGACADGIGADGACDCDAGWAGLTCAVCAEGFTGEDCDACEPGHFGPDCAPCACGVGVCAEGLLGDGACTTATSCQDIRDRLPSVPDGVYPLDVDGAGPMGPSNFFCEMTTDGAGWTVLFESSDPAHWDSGSGTPGVAPWSHDLATAPTGMSEVRLSRPETGESQVVTGVGAVALTSCLRGSNGLWWDGTNAFVYGARHLGVASDERVYEGVNNGYVIVGTSCHNDHRSWGFGHRGWIDDRQAWGWDSTDLGESVFRVGVR